MRRSKLEMYVDILKVLTRHGPLKLTHIMYKANVNCNELKDTLTLFVEKALVEEKTMDKKHMVYAISERGTTVLKYFRELKAVLPIMEEARAGAKTLVLNRPLPPSLY